MMKSSFRIETKTLNQVLADDLSGLPEAQMIRAADRNQKLVIVMRQDQLGCGPEEPGRSLLQPYFNALLELERPPQSVLFYHTAVRLLTRNSPILQQLQALQDKGVELLACSLSLQQLDLCSERALGELSTQAILLDRQLHATILLWP